ncbi:hypothetical protein EVAR_9979_1 [Eumeta japonica]|uniref:Uncharacterized protein n=1 Tax=Eumeta variegata TaxID=151549 RepID=A0A4C1TR00_EUMVA|nr:hypothetical protein EVAR_9979_1 [Eumeta japonica]
MGRAAPGARARARASSLRASASDGIYSAFVTLYFIRMSPSTLYIRAAGALGASPLTFEGLLPLPRAPWEDSRDAISIFCDLSKAFDCVHHETLIGKLRHYGVTGRALDLLKSYLSNRVQRVDVNVRNKELEFVNSTVFLGITLDDRLQWVLI